jgi:hypothetical protein
MTRWFSIDNHPLEPYYVIENSLYHEHCAQRAGVNLDSPNIIKCDKDRKIAKRENYIPTRMPNEWRSTVDVTIMLQTVAMNCMSCNKLIGNKLSEPDARNILLDHYVTGNHVVTNKRRTNSENIIILHRVYGFSLDRFAKTEKGKPAYPFQTDFPLDGLDLPTKQG